MHTIRLSVLLGGVKLTFWVCPLLRTRIVVVKRSLTVPKGTEFYGKMLNANEIIAPGTLLYSRWIGNGDKRRRIYQRSESIYRVLQAYEHADVSEEYADRQARVSIETAVAVVRDLIAHGRCLTANQRMRLKEKLAMLQARYELARRECLREATEKIEAAADLKDRLGRHNPGATAARVTAARLRYEVRLEEITAIVPHLSRFRMAVLQEISRIWWLLEQDETLLRQALRAIPRVREEAHVRWIAENLRTVLDHIKTIVAAPFFFNCQHMTGELALALRKLSDQTYMPARRVSGIAPILKTMLASLAFKNAQRELERNIYRISRQVRDGRFKDGQATRTVKIVEEFRARALRLDESVFRRKRIAQVDIHLALALEKFRVRAVEEAREALKDASALL